MEQIWEIIGIVFAVLMVIIGLRLLLKKSDSTPPVEIDNLPVEEQTQQPIVPRHAREDVDTDVVSPVVTPAPEHQQPAEAAVKEEPEEEVVSQPTKKSDEDAEEELAELQAELKKEADLVAEAKTQEKIEDEDNDKSESLEVEKLELGKLSKDEEDWEDESTVLDVHLNEQYRHDEESALATAQKIVALYLYPNPERALSGERTLKVLLKYGLRYGEMSCFHRYESSSEQSSPLMFSVLRIGDDGAPTAFDLEMLPTEEIKGLAFFLALPNQNAVQGFDMMASIALLIARDIDGVVFDEQSLELTPQLRDHWRHYVIEYDPNQPPALD